MPHHWAIQDWLEEMEAEAAAAALQAARDFDPGRNVPWEAFLRRRIMAAALARYRREWVYARRRVSDSDKDFPAGALPRAHSLREEDFAVLLRALQELPAADLVIIEGIYWDGNTENALAGDLGVSQQAVSKRKHAILRALRGILLALEKEDWWL
jgi:RNA polymerase sigma factor (sigma-70 family)